MGNNPSTAISTKVYRTSNGQLYYKRQRNRVHKDESILSVVVDGKRRKFYEADDGTIWYRDENKCWYPYTQHERVSRSASNGHSCYIDDRGRSCSPDSYPRSSFDRPSSVETRRRSYYADETSSSCYVNNLGQTYSADIYSRGSFERIRTHPVEEYRRSYYVHTPSESYSRRFGDDKVSVRVINVDKSLD